MVIILNEKHKWYQSLRWKLFFSFLFISFVPLVFFSVIAISSLEQYYNKDTEYKILNAANVVAGNISKAKYLTEDIKKPLFDEELDKKSKEGSYRIIVFDNKAMVVNDTNKTETGKIFIVPEVIEALEKKDTARTNVKERLVYAAASILDAESKKIGVVLIVASSHEIYNALHEIENKMLLFAVLIIFVIVILVLFASQLIIDPLNGILKVVEKMSDGYLYRRIELKSHDEFKDLAVAFNTMTEKLERVEKTREEFVSNVSHELKTPLSSIKVLTESILLQENAPIEMYNEFMGDINSEIDRMTDIINDLLNLVKLDQRELKLNIKQLNLNILMEEVLRRLYPLAKQKEIDLIFEENRNIVIEADEMKLSLAISNLVDNGIKYTHKLGTVKVTVDADHQSAFISVADTGIGISEDEQSKVFNRFYRVDKTRDRETGGTGLGLAITHSVVLLHNGSIRLTSKENEGTTFTVRIPIHHI